ncbi:MAG: amidohydrolase family protein [Bryobacteraceae bacterium]
MMKLSRRDWLGGLAAAGAGAVLGGRSLAQTTRKTKLINVHHHLTSPAYVKFLQDNKVRQFPNKSAQQGLEEMDKAGIDTAICSIIGPGIHFGNLADTRRMARACNEYAAKLVSDYPGRFGIFTVLPLPDIDGSLKEIEYGFDTLKADGVYLFTNWGEMPLYGDKYIGDPALAPIYQELNRRKAVIYTHPKDNACCREIIPGLSDTTIEYGTDTTRAIASLLFSGTASKYPDVKFIMSHAGGTMPFLISRFIGGAAAYLQEGGKLKAGAPPERARPTLPKGPLYELQKFYWDTANAANPISLSALRRMLPFEQILFGADFPFADLAEDRKLLAASATLSPKELEQIGYDNVIRLLPKYKV